MKIVSWNIWIDNKNQVESFKTMLELEQADTICLQEVSDTLLKYFLYEQEEFNVDFCRDFKRTGYNFDQKNKNKTPKHTTDSQNTEIAFLVILSKLPFHNKQNFQIHHKDNHSLLARKVGITEPREFHFIDVHCANGSQMRIFNLHLEMASGSKRRQEEFLNAMINFDDTKVNIVCGDFNIFAHPTLNLFIGWSLNYELRDYIVRERKAFQRIFEKFNFVNIFYRKITYPRFRLQLDHILLPGNSKHEKAFVSKNLHGSDHRYISCELIDN